MKILFVAVAPLLTVNKVVIVMLPPSTNWLNLPGVVGMYDKLEKVFAPVIVILVFQIFTVQYVKPPHAKLLPPPVITIVLDAALKVRFVVVLAAQDVIFNVLAHKVILLVQAHVILKAPVLNVCQFVLNVPVKAHAVNEEQFIVAVPVTVPQPEFASNVTVSAEVGTLCPPAPPEVADQFVVVAASQFHVPQTQKRDAINKS